MIFKRQTSKLTLREEKKTSDVHGSMYQKPPSKRRSKQKGRTGRGAIEDEAEQIEA